MHVTVDKDLSGDCTAIMEGNNITLICTYDQLSVASNTQYGFKV